MEEKEYNYFSKNAKRAFIIGEIIQTFVVIVVCGAIIAGLLVFNAPIQVQYIVWIISALLMIFSICTIFFEGNVGFKRRRYKISDESIELIGGVWLKSHEIVPIRRMQQINIEQGFIKKLLDLSDVTILTAGGSMTIECLDVDVAQNLNEELTQKINDFAKKEVQNEY